MVESSSQDYTWKYGFIVNRKLLKSKPTQNNTKLSKLSIVRDYIHSPLMFLSNKNIFSNKIIFISKRYILPDCCNWDTSCSQDDFQTLVSIDLVESQKHQHWSALAFVEDKEVEEVVGVGVEVLVEVEAEENTLEGEHLRGTLVALKLVKIDKVLLPFKIINCHFNIHQSSTSCRNDKMNFWKNGKIPKSK